MTGETLRRQAREAARWRGHTLSRFVRVHHGVWTQTWTAQCTADGCTAGVTVDTHPAPNGIDIGGRAVALNHPDTEDDRPEPLTIAEIAAAEGIDAADLARALRESHPDASPSEVIYRAHNLDDRS